MSDPFNIHDAKTHFLKRLEPHPLGEEVVIAKTGTPIAKLVPMSYYALRMLGKLVALQHYCAEDSRLKQ